MDRDSVIAFLGRVPLVQSLPSSSLTKIADAIKVKHYDQGEYIIHEGQVGDGVYFICNGQAEVIGSFANERNQSELRLKPYDYYGHVIGGPLHPVNVIALTKLTCCVLQYKDGNLLQPKSMWNAEGITQYFSVVEHILNLDVLDVDIFRGYTSPDAPALKQVYGGQFIGQGLTAASKTVDCFKLAHSLHAYFLATGDNNLPIIYRVHRVHDGSTFATRRVDAMQCGITIFTLLASFKNEERGFEHQEVFMPRVPCPELLLPMEESREHNPNDPPPFMQYKKGDAEEKFVPWPIEIRFCNEFVGRLQPSLKYWFKAREKLSDDPALHRCVLAYASDYIFASVSLDPHRREGLETSSLSLDHSMWFHRPVRADDWLLFVIEAPSAYGGRGFAIGHMFNRKGELVTTLTQEALIRKVKPRNKTTKSKL